MRIAGAIARILMGLVFFVLGSNGFLHFIPAPPMGGLAGEFMDVFARSHWMLAVSAVQVIAGALLLVNQFVPLALVALAAVLFNILTYHVTMQPEGLPIPIFVTVLWFIAAFSVRAQFAPLLARGPRETPENRD